MFVIYVVMKFEQNGTSKNLLDLPLLLNNTVIKLPLVDIDPIDLQICRLSLFHLRKLLEGNIVQLLVTSNLFQDQSGSNDKVDDDVDYEYTNSNDQTGTSASDTSRSYPGFYVSMLAAVAAISRGLGRVNLQTTPTTTTTTTTLLKNLV